jgi:hypothetical protein
MLQPRFKISSAERASAVRCCGSIPSSAHAWPRSFDNLRVRIAEASRNRWLGEVQGLPIRLDAARGTMAAIERITQATASGPTLLGCLATRPVPVTGRSSS